MNGIDTLNKYVFPPCQTLTIHYFCLKIEPLKKSLLVIIGGPTGIGKTALGIKIAQAFRTEIISADSRQVYKELCIGTAVPEPEELEAVNHHFIQIKSVEEPYNASRYEFEVIDKLNHLFLERQVVVMVGGSGMYIDAVCEGIDDLPSIPPDVRQKYFEIYENEGLTKIQEMVKEYDPEYFEKVDKNNHKRLLKALEVNHVSNKKYSSFLKNEIKARPFDMLKIILDMDREELYNRINLRVDKMMEKGLEDEAWQMLPKRGTVPLKTVGYKEFFEYFDGSISREEAIVKIKNHSRAYARRQLTWFRRYNDAHWFSPEQHKEIISLIKQQLK